MFKLLRNALALTIGVAFIVISSPLLFWLGRSQPVARESVDDDPGVDIDAEEAA